MGVALAFGRHDVDAFLDEIPHQQLQEWFEYFNENPHGWAATNLLIRRVCYTIAQASSPKKLREDAFGVRFTRPASNAVEKARLEAFAIRQQISEAKRAR
jgi:hypothetical protein